MGGVGEEGNFKMLNCHIHVVDLRTAAHSGTSTNRRVPITASMGGEFGWSSIHPPLSELSVFGYPHSAVLVHVPLTSFIGSTESTTYF